MAIMCEISWGSTQCKTIVMDVHMKKCRHGARAKRDMERIDLLKYDEKLKREEGPGELITIIISDIYMRTCIDIFIFL